MFQLRTKLIAIGVAIALTAGGYAAVGAFAGSGTPWPGSSQGPAIAGHELEGTGTPEATEAPEGSETPHATRTPDAAETPHATRTPKATRTPEAAETPDDADTEDESDDDALGVPTDSPACAGDLATPNPHDTDGDGDGCREVENGDGTTINLPDPAADAHDGTPGLIGREHGNGHGGD